MITTNWIAGQNARATEFAQVRDVRHHLDPGGAAWVVVEILRDAPDGRRLRLTMTVAEAESLMARLLAATFDARNQERNR